MAWEPCYGLRMDRVPYVGWAAITAGETRSPCTPVDSSVQSKPCRGDAAWATLGTCVFPAWAGLFPEGSSRAWEWPFQLQERGGRSRTQERKGEDGMEWAPQEWVPGGRAAGLTQTEKAGHSRHHPGPSAALLMRPQATKGLLVSAARGFDRAG